MFSFLSRIIDHILFTALFIAGIQFPAFIQQYKQLINGKLSEASFHLQKYQNIADQFFSGKLSELITNYQQNADPAVNHTATLLSDTVERVGFLQGQFDGLSQESYLHKLWYFVREVDVASAELTLKNFQPAIPLSIEAISTGVVFAIVALALKFMAGWLIGQAFQLTKPKRLFR